MGKVGDNRRAAMALGCAIGVHVVCTYALGHVHVVPVERQRVEPLAVATIEIETTDENKVIDVPPGDVSRGARAANDRGTAARVVAGMPVKGAAEAPASEVAPLVNADGSDGNWSLQVTRVDIGIDGHGGQTAIGRAGSAATATATAIEASRGTGSATGGLVESLDENDVAMGLGRGGPIRSAVEDAVQASNVMGTAAFEVQIETSGVVSVGLRHASVDAASWSRLAETIRATVIAKRASVRLPPGARGLSVVVEASAKDLLPDGRSPSRLGTRLEGTMGSVTETKERVDIKLPSATLAHEGKVCAAGLHVGLDGIGILGGCSPENAGQMPVRMVAARVVREARL